MAQEWLTDPGQPAAEERRGTEERPAPGERPVAGDRAPAEGRPAAEAPPVLEARDVSVWLGGRWALDGISLAIRPGELAVVTGPNGAGKSLLARALVGVQPLSAGRVTVGGVDVRRRRARRQIGYLPQSGGLYADLTVAENIAFFAALAGVPRRQRRKVCEDLLELVGLSGPGLREAEVFRLTPGQRRRLLLARALAGDHPVLVLDEPLLGLDGAGRADVRQILAELAGLGKAVLAVTGDVDGLATDRLWRLDGGRLKGGAA